MSKTGASSRMSRWGYGPLYVTAIAALTICGIVASHAGLLDSGRITHAWLPVVFLVIGVVVALAGVTLWIAAVVGARVMRHIDDGQLVTRGVYGWVRHPIYAAFMLTFTGILLTQANWWLLILPPMFWVFLTVLMKNTEERWLHHTFGTAYADYAKRVNRCIPTPPCRSQHN